MGLKHNFFSFLLTHTPEEQFVLSTLIQYPVNQSIIQSSLFYLPGSFFRRIGQVLDERVKLPAQSLLAPLCNSQKVFWNAVEIVL